MILYRIIWYLAYGHLFRLFKVVWAFGLLCHLSLWIYWIMMYKEITNVCVAWGSKRKELEIELRRLYSSICGVLTLKNQWGRKTGECERVEFETLTTSFQLFKFEYVCSIGSSKNLGNFLLNELMVMSYEFLRKRSSISILIDTVILRCQISSWRRNAGNKVLSS